MKPNTNPLISILKYSPLVIWSVLIIFPLAMMLFISLKTDAEYVHTLPYMPTWSFHFQNYIRAFTEARLLKALGNSFVLVFFGSVGSIILGAMTAYCLSRFDFFLKPILKSTYVISAIVPGALLQVMVYKLFSVAGLTGTMTAPVLIYISTDILQVWIYMQFFERISVSLDESAMMEGASYFRIFYSIIFPLLLPATATILILKSITIYNDLFTQYLFMSSVDLATATIALMMFTGQFATSMFNVMSAGIVIVMLPTVLLFLFFQRYIFSGITAGSVKE